MTLAGFIAGAAGAELSVRAVVDDGGVPPIDWSAIGSQPSDPAERERYARMDVELMEERPAPRSSAWTLAQS